MNWKLILAVGAIFFFGTAYAQNPAVDFEINDLRFNGNIGATLGWKFTVNTNVYVTHLGLLDENLDGFVESHQIGLWEVTNTSTPLATAVVSGTNQSLIVGNFRYEPIAPITLAAGQSYVIAYQSPPYSDRYEIGAISLVTDSTVTYQEGRYAPTTVSLVFPSNTFTTTSYFGPNFLLEIADTAESLACDGFEPPMADYPVAFKKNHSLPLRAEVFDTDGIEMTNVELESPPVVQVWFDSGDGGDAILITDDVLSAGQSDEGNQFYFTDSNLWQFILDTRNYAAPGTYTAIMESGDQSEYIFDPTCLTEFVIE